MRELEQAQETLKATRAERNQKRLVIETDHATSSHQRAGRSSREARSGGRPPGALDSLPADPSAERQRLVREIAMLRDRLPGDSGRGGGASSARKGVHVRPPGDFGRAPWYRGDLRRHRGSWTGERTPQHPRSGDPRSAARVTSDTPKIFERTLTSQEESTLRTLVLRDLHDRVRTHQSPGTGSGRMPFVERWAERCRRPPHVPSSPASSRPWQQPCCWVAGRPPMGKRARCRPRAGGEHGVGPLVDSSPGPTAMAPSETIPGPTQVPG